MVWPAHRIKQEGGWRILSPVSDCMQTLFLGSCALAWQRVKRPPNSLSFSLSATSDFNDVNKLSAGWLSTIILALSAHKSCACTARTGVWSTRFGVHQHQGPTLTSSSEIQLVFIFHSNKLNEQGTIGTFVHGTKEKKNPTCNLTHDMGCGIYASSWSFTGAATKASAMNPLGVGKRTCMVIASKKKRHA